jgi:hypothetical protein
MVEFGFIFDNHLTLEYATREGARVGAALANGGGTMGCSAGQSPNAASVDKQIIAAVQRVVTSPGSPVERSRVSSIKIYKSTSSGAINGGFVNTWVYRAGAGPVVDGQPLDFIQQGGTGWAACTRDNGGTPDSLGVSLVYDYHMVTPLDALMGFFGPSGGSPTVTLTDHTVMALNPGN